MPSVLIIDEAPLRIRWLESVLQSMGWQWQCCGMQAESLPGTDITLLALHLRQGNGFEFATVLREQGHGSIWLLSDWPCETDALWARSLGLAGVLRVPAPVEDFCALLQASLEDCHEDASA